MIAGMQDNTVITTLFTKICLYPSLCVNPNIIMIVTICKFTV